MNWVGWGGAQEFLEDLTLLGCRFPDVLTRVSEYIQEIVDFCQKIIGNGMAYAANGSVYFDTQSFQVLQSLFLSFLHSGLHIFCVTRNSFP
jgi:cysteinyl-tRNA synthetase